MKHVVNGREVNVLVGRQAFAGSHRQKRSSFRFPTKANAEYRHEEAVIIAEERKRVSARSMAAEGADGVYRIEKSLLSERMKMRLGLV